MNRKLVLGAALLALGVAGAAVVVTLGGQGEDQVAEAPPKALSYVVPAAVGPVSPPAQPLPYSHKIHAGDLGLECGFCHTGGERTGTGTGTAPGAMMTFPETETCMGCHGEIATDRPSIIRLTAYHNENQPVPWRRVYSVAKGVSWSHRVHLEASLQCETCHGDVSSLEVMAQITGVAAMSSCISCHQASGAKTECQTCHAWPSEKQLLRWNN